MTSLKISSKVKEHFIMSTEKYIKDNGTIISSMEKANGKVITIHIAKENGLKES